MIHTADIKAIMFDFDGTLSQAGAIDFNEIRKEIGCPPGKPILEFIEKIAVRKNKHNALATLDHLEMHAAAITTVDPNAAEVVSHLRKKGIKLGVITRNSRKSVLRAFENFEDLSLSDFDLIITRDNPIPPKPSGEGIRIAAQKWGIETYQILMVGDFTFDIEAGQRAGSLTVLLDRKSDPRLAEVRSDFRIKNLLELLQIFQLTQPLNNGKLPNELLGSFLREFEFTDPAVLVSAGIGDDTAAVDVSREEVIVLKSDPITFATDEISQYAVLVNANDIATAGAIPRWFLTTLLFPPKTTALSIRTVMNNLFHICRQWEITLCGGHTEITDAVSRPIVIGMMAGTVSRANLIEKKNMKPGNKILITKSVAVEGTAIIAREFSKRLLSLGVTQEDIAVGREFLSKISVLPEARLASKSKAATAIHDVTEGGLAAAVEELSLAGGHRLKINMDAIPCFKLTRRFGELLNIDPLGLIGSGSLLICCQEHACEKLMYDLEKKGIAVACIGEVLSPGKGVEAYRHGSPSSWPHFAVDEITRLFSK